VFDRLCTAYGELTSVSHTLARRTFPCNVAGMALTASSVYHHVDIAAAALRANQPPAPFRHWRLWPIPACLLAWVKFTPVTTGFAPDRKPERGGGAFECRRRAAVGFIDAGYIAPCSVARIFVGVAAVPGERAPASAC
jgi:hypothetical protein